MKLWSRLCFLVLVVSPVCLGNQTINHPSVNGSTAAPPPSFPEENENQTSSVNMTLLETNNTSSGDNIVTQTEQRTEPPTTVTPKVKGSEDVQTSTVPMTTSTNKLPAGAGSSAGYVILGLIIIVIIVLCIILYLLRRASRTYSFDLQRPSPASHLNQPTGTFEPVYLDDLERPVPKDIAATDDHSSPPVANGTGLHSEEKDSTGETAPEDQPEANGVETSPTDDTSSSSSSGSDEAGKASDPPSSTNLFFDAIGEQQNENNNNPTVSSSDPFVEINLDEPAWCDQLLNSSEPSSSVLPFSPFSLSSSSS